MARPLRIEFPGALYHVTARGNEGSGGQVSHCPCRNECYTSLLSC